MIVRCAIVKARRVLISMLSRNFHEWCKTIPKEEQKRISGYSKAPLNLVNYLWISKIMHQKTDPSIPTVQEMLDWILTSQIDAIRK